MTTNPYDHEHQKRRDELLPGAYNQLCPLCGELMLKGQELHLDHTDPVATDKQSKGDRIVHGECNTRAGGKLGSRRAKMPTSRQW